LKAQDRRKIAEEVKLVDGLMHNIIRDGMTVTDVNRLLYAGQSFVVASRLGVFGKKKGSTKKKSWWQRRLESNIEEWREDLGRIDEVKLGNKVRQIIRERLERKYQIVAKGTTVVSTMLKNKISSASAKIRQFVGKCVARRQNNLFRNNQSQLYKESSRNGCKNEAAIPNADEASEFWSRLWS